MRIYYLNPPLNNKVLRLDYTWMSFKAFCPEHEWIEPILDWAAYPTVESVVEHALASRPELVLFSIYVWNEELCHAIARQLRAKLPASVRFIIGGPQVSYSPDYLKTHPYYDYSCSRHGEVFLRAALPQLEQYGALVDLSQVPYAVSKTEQNFNQSYFQWESINLAANSAEYVVRMKAVADKTRRPLALDYESTRGCPFQCTYCEWGGGIGTRVIAKPLEQVLAELELFLMLGVEELGITDANFGILKRDAEVLDFIGRTHRALGFPKEVMLYGLAKTKRRQRQAVLERLLDYGLADHFFMAFQTTNPQALTSSKRTDLNQIEYLELFEDLRARYGVVGKVELILGLPDSTLADFYREMDYIQFTHGWQYARNVLTVLPNAELAQASYRAQHRIETFWAGVSNNEEQYHGESTYNQASILSQYRSRVEIVCQANGYSRREWQTMHVLDIVQRLVGPHLTRRASVIFPRLWTALLQEPWFGVIDEHYRRLFNNEIYHDFLMLDEQESLLDFFERQIPNPRDYIRALEKPDDPLPCTLTELREAAVKSTGGV